MSNEVSFDLSGKVMIVTGAGKGIGKSIAETASHYGASLALGSRTVSECEETAEICRAQGVQAEAWQLDVTCLDSIDRFVAQTWDTFGRIDSVVNNAGNNIPKPALDYTEEEFDSMSDVNFKGPFFMSNLLRPPHDRGRHRGQHYFHQFAGGRRRRAAAINLRLGQGRGRPDDPVAGGGVGRRTPSRSTPSRRPSRARPCWSERSRTRTSPRTWRRSRWGVSPSRTKLPAPSSTWPLTRPGW